MPVDVFLPLLPKVYSGPQRISPSSLVYHCVACVLVSLQKEGAAYARKGARPEPIAARAWRVGHRPTARATYPEHRLELSHVAECLKQGFHAREQRKAVEAHGVVLAVDEDGLKEGVGRGAQGFQAAEGFVITASGKVGAVLLRDGADAVVKCAFGRVFK